MRPAGVMLSRGNCRIFEPFVEVVDQFVQAFFESPTPYLQTAIRLARRSA